MYDDQKHESKAFSEPALGNYDNLPQETSPGEGKIRDIRIQELDLGFIVHVGCQSFALTEKDDLIKHLTNYIYDPRNCEDFWFKNKKLC